MQFNIQQSSEWAEIWLWTKIEHILGFIPQATYKAAVESVFLESWLGSYTVVIASKTTPDPFARPVKSSSNEEIQSSEVEKDDK